MSGRLKGLVSIVSGAASGIGRAVALRYVAEGASVIALDRNAQRLDELAQSHPEVIHVVSGDVREAQPHARAVEAAMDLYGKLDVLVGNAGVFDFWRPLRRYDAAGLAAAFDEVFAVNVKAYAFGALAAAKALTQTKGSMIFTASVAGLGAGGGGLLYTASKHAIVGLIRQLAFELAPDIRVNGVAPGATRTALAAPETFASARTLADLSLDDARGPLGFVQEPEHHAGLYVMLAAPGESPAVTGEILVSDAGLGLCRQALAPKGLGSRAVE